MDLALRTMAPLKPTDGTAEKDRKSHDEWEYSNSCYVMIMRYYMDEPICDSISKAENAKDFLTAIEKKYENFSKNEKNRYLNMLHSTFYDGASDIRAHIDKLMGCYHKLKAMGMDLKEGYIVWFVMGTLPS